MNLIQLQQQKISSDNVYQFLLYFDKRYDHFTDAEKKEFMTSFIERIDIYPERLPSGRILKHIDFRFLVFYKEQEITGVGWDNENGVETCLYHTIYEVKVYHRAIERILIMFFPIVILAITDDSDREFMKALYIKYHLTMFRMARALTDSKYDAEDVVSDACVSLIKKNFVLRYNTLKEYL